MNKLFKYFLILLLSSVAIYCQEKPKVEEKPTEIKVDPLLDPLYFVANINQVLEKRTKLFRKRKGDVPEQLWKIKTPGAVTCQPIYYNYKLVLGTSTGRHYYIDLKTGASIGKAAETGVPLGYIGLKDSKKFVCMSWIGTLSSFSYEWENLVTSSNDAYKSYDLRPLSGLAWLNGIIVTRRDDYPIYVDMLTGKAASKLNKPWTSGFATAPLLYTFDNFWLATSKSELLSIDTKLSQVNSIIRLKKSFATALAFENSILYSLTAEGELYSIDRLTGIEQWQIKLDSAGVDSMICEDGQIFVNAGSFYVINGKDGSILFERKTRANEKFKRTKPIVTKKRIYTCDSDGMIYIFNRQDFKLIQAINLEEDVMVNFICVDNVLYVPTIVGNFYAIDVSLY